MIKKFALGTLSICISVTLHAAAIAFDSASDPTYQPPFTNWASGDNGGFGFGAWFGVTDQYVGDSDANGSGVNSGGAATPPGVDIDTPADAPLTLTGASWALRGDGGVAGEAFRPFLGDLAVGQTFRLDLDNGFLNTGESAGFGLRDGGTNLFEFYFQGGDSFYTVNDGTGENPTTVGFTQFGLRTSFTLTSATTYSFTIDSLGTGPGIDQLFTGSLASGAIDNVRLFNFSTSGDAFGNAFYNSMEVVPEPSTWLVGAMALGACFYLRRRNRRA